MEGDEKLKRFRLVSIYVGNFGCFHDQIFNFCSDYTMKREPDQAGKLCLKVTHEKVLPDNFFSLPKPDNSDDKASSASQTDGTQKTPSDISCVDSILAIIGKNGTGKSTLARLLCNLPHDDSKTEAENDRWNVVVVYECDGALYGYSTKGKNYVSVVDRDGKDICLDSRGILLGNSENAAVVPVPDKPCYRFFYYSPCYTTEQPSLEQPSDLTIADSRFDDNGEDVKIISTTGLMNNPELHTQMMGNLKPTFAYEMDELRRSSEFLAAYQKKFAEFEKRQSNPLRSFDIPRPGWIWAWNVRAPMGNLPHEHEQDCYWKKLPDDIREKVCAGEICKFRLDDPKQFAALCDLIFMHKNVILKTASAPFLKFIPVPRMSSGQMSFISLFARLYQFVTKPRDGIERPVVIFLDEAETTLHPEWQQRLVSYLIRFLNVFMPERRYQLIFASHSPTLLSDIPKGNCVFLQWSKKNDKNGLPINESVPFTVKDGECENTFGANIYDLYHNAFFLEHGAIGEFAEEKIQDALKAVKKAATTELVGDKNAPLDKEIDLLMNLVGDRIVHRYFQRLKEFGLITERA